MIQTIDVYKRQIKRSYRWKKLSHKKIIYNGNGMQNFERTRNRILYSQNKYEKYDLNIEYNDSIKMKSDDLETSLDEETDEFD